MRRDANDNQCGNGGDGCRVAVVDAVSRRLHIAADREGQSEVVAARNLHNLLTVKQKVLAHRRLHVLDVPEIRRTARIRPAAPDLRVQSEEKGGVVVCKTNADRSVEKRFNHTRRLNNLLASRSGRSPAENPPRLSKRKAVGTTACHRYDALPREFLADWRKLTIEGHDSAVRECSKQAHLLARSELRGRREIKRSRSVRIARPPDKKLATLACDRAEFTTAGDLLELRPIGECLHALPSRGIRLGAGAKTPGAAGAPRLNICLCAGM